MYTYPVQSIEQRYWLCDSKGRPIDDPALCAHWAAIIHADRLRLRREFIAAFPPPDTDMLRSIAGFYQSLEISALPPIVHIGRTKHNARKAMSILRSSVTPLLFEEQNFCSDEAIATTPCHGSLHMNLLVFLSTQRAWLRFGAEFCDLLLILEAVHELGHGTAFDKSPGTAIALADDGSLIGSMPRPLSGNPIYTIEGGRLQHEYRPSWIDEALATYFEGLYRRRVMGLPSGPGHHLSFDGIDVKIPEHYLLRHPDYPDAPGTMGGALVATDLERIDRQFPGVLETIISTCRGTIPVEQLHLILREVLGDLADEVVLNRHTYEDWPSVSLHLRDRLAQL